MRSAGILHESSIGSIWQTHGPRMHQQTSAVT